LGLEGFRVSGFQGFRLSRVSGLKGSRISGFKGFRVSRVSGLKGFRVSGCSLNELHRGTS
jgi:hypothetical protein